MLCHVLERLRVLDGLHGEGRPGAVDVHHHAERGVEKFLNLGVIEVTEVTDVVAAIHPP